MPPTAAAISASWAVPTLGGQPRPYLDGAAEFDWSRDGSRLVYHTSRTRRIRYSSPTMGCFRRVHPSLLRRPGCTATFRCGGQTRPSSTSFRAHSPTNWTSGASSRRRRQGTNNLAHQPSEPSVFLDQRTLMYLASASDGSGPWLYSIDVERPRSPQVSLLAWTVTPRYRLVRTGADWWLHAQIRSEHSGGVPIGEAPAEVSCDCPYSAYDQYGILPAAGPGFTCFYVSSNGTSESIWRLDNGRPRNFGAARERKSSAVQPSPPMDGPSRSRPAAGPDRSCT